MGTTTNAGGLSGRQQRYVSYLMGQEDILHRYFNREEAGARFGGCWGGALSWKS